MQETLQIRAATTEDAETIWAIFHEVVQGGEAYVFDPATDQEKAMRYWFAPGNHVYVAVTDGVVLGSYILKANHPDLGGHVANASYMVSSKARGQGIGGIMCEHSIQEAARLGFLAMQFNIVVSTNHAAVALWKKHGFQIVGTVPQAFRHRTQGLVDTYVMHRRVGG